MKIKKKIDVEVKIYKKVCGKNCPYLIEHIIGSEAAVLCGLYGKLIRVTLEGYIRCLKCKKEFGNE